MKKKMNIYFRNFLILYPIFCASIIVSSPLLVNVDTEFLVLYILFFAISGSIVGLYGMRAMIYGY